MTGDRELIIEQVWKNYTELGATAYEQGQLDLAERMFAAAVSEARKAGDHELSAGMSMNNLGLVYFQQGRNKEAERLLKQALEICQVNFGRNSLYVANILDVLAEIHIRQGRFEKSIPLSRRALPILERELGPDHPRVARLLTNVAWDYCNRQKYDRAVAVYQRVQKITNNLMPAGAAVVPPVTVANS